MDFIFRITSCPELPFRIYYCNEDNRDATDPEGFVILAYQAEAGGTNRENV